MLAQFAHHKSIHKMTSSRWYTSLLLLSLVHSGVSFTVCREKSNHNWSALASVAPRFSQNTPSPSDPSSPEEEIHGPLTWQDSVREFFLNLTRLSLQDYEWRSNYFKSTEADRMLEESLARMQGTNRPYLRPMDASEETIGPLGRWEKSTVEWLSSVIDEEGRRAKKIVSQDGKLIRPIDTIEGEEELGPLGFLEKQVSDFIQTIRQSEQERVRTKTLQPKNLPEEVRGPLGTLELAVSRFLKELQASEQLRAEQSRRRGGEIVRPIDVPGPLGEWEMKIADILRAEERRAMELNKNEGRVLRPKDARYRGPLGEAEQALYDLFDQLRAEENERFRSIQQLLQDKRPMENDRKSVLGVSEAIVVGVFRAPQLIMSVIQRVTELLKSEMLSQSDEEILSDASSDKKPSSR